MRRLSLPVLVAAAVLCAPAVAHAVEIEEVADGLRSPRHLDFSPWGDLYVAEAGRGGNEFCFVGGEGDACSGPTGAITRISSRGNVSRVVDGLGSYANVPNFDSGIGPHGLIADWAGVFFTSGGPTAPRDMETGELLSRRDLAREDPSADSFGRLLWLPYWSHRPKEIADIYKFEVRKNPDGGAVDTNATDVVLDHGRFAISDAGGNSVIATDRGRLRTLAVFPEVLTPNPFGPPDPFPMQAVPTSLVEGPDGAYYMSQLTGFPFPVGGAKVYRINPRTGRYTVYADGFTNIMDLAFDKRGTLYVLEIDSNGIIIPPGFGAVHAVTRRGARSVVVPPDGTLTEPGGITVGPRGDLFVSNESRSPDAGEVLRITP